MSKHSKKAPEIHFQQNDIVLLFYMQKYRFLTIKQAAKILNLSGRHKEITIARRLKTFEEEGYSGSFGNAPVGFRRAPKVYYIKRKGYELLFENGIDENLLDRFKEKNNPKWSPVFMHRIELIDLFLSLETGLRNFPDIELIKVFMEYSRVKKGNCETMDYISEDRTPENKIIPDGVFILKNKKTGQAALYLLELDKGTETIMSMIAPNSEKNTLYARMRKYDEYLLSRNYAEKYKAYGDFKNFALLFVTTSKARINNIRSKSASLSKDYHPYYLFNTYDTVKDDFFNASWQSRDIEDTKTYRMF